MLILLPDLPGVTVLPSSERIVRAIRIGHRARVW
jgi:hypothetical protein